MQSDREPTAFERQVYAATSQIPKGRVSTYAWIGRAIGCGSARAIGQALRRNPYAPTVPCHRVIRSDGTLGGFNGQTEGEELERKVRLLTEEGVRLVAGRLADPQQRWPLASDA